MNLFDDNGNLMRSESSDGKVVTRNYNGFNWQTDYVSADVSLWFRYLPNGLRYSKQKRTDSTCTVTTHHWDGSDIVMDVSQNGTVKGRYLRGNGKLIAEDIAGSLTYYFFNAHGDVINRVNSDGVVLKTYKYDSFGNIINPATVGDPNDPIYVDQSPFGYAGEYLDKENGEIYLRARYYSSEYGRFVTEDPSQHSSNWYSYCDNNPVTQADRTGLRPTTDGSAGSDKIVNDYMKETYPKQQQSVTHPAPEPPQPEPPKPSKPTPKPPSTPSYIKQYNPDHNEFEPPFYDNTEEEVEETPTFVEESSANIIEDIVITSYEAIGSGLIKASSTSHFKSHIDDALKLNGAAFTVAGVGIDFVGELQDGNGVLGAAILAAGHFATYMFIEMIVKAFVLSHLAPSLIVVAGITIASIIITSAITTQVDRRIN